MPATVSLKSGEVIFREGDSENSMYVILQGSVEIYFKIKAQETRVAILKKGDFFGEMALFRAKPRTATARAMTDTELAVIESKQQLERFLIQNPTFSAKMVSIMATRLANTNELLIEKINETSAKEIEYQQPIINS
ncbi:MAG: cyclic nucleotide-binding domain-containing protein [Leptospiraceae bacterium]|nr:cyclic nucleotide-binding domain-containing protein [Leptospiraceae bacterium]MCK6380934.1 cyclic nucleotide-binding domain-containing protein [Leptospiraceae bacterium]NUM40010.1 cyclic nucleotide-binding domain-containing protein [Leptospiraceae bacterium]